MVSVDISVEFDGLDRVKDDLERVQGAIEPPKLTESLGLGADIYVSAARSFAPKGETLALAASIGKVQIGPAEWEVSPFVNFPERVYLYAATQETGQVHHPVYADFMTFQGRAGWVRARSVDIPGTHYMELARGAAEEPAAQRIKEDINRNIEG